MNSKAKLLFSPFFSLLFSLKNFFSFQSLVLSFRTTNLSPKTNSNSLLSLLPFAFPKFPKNQAKTKATSYFIISPLFQPFPTPKVLFLCTNLQISYIWVLFMCNAIKFMFISTQVGCEEAAPLCKEAIASLLRGSYYT